MNLTFANSSPIRKFTFGLVACTLLLGVSFFFSYHTSTQINSNFKLVRHTFLVKEKLELAIAKLTETESMVRGYLITGNSDFLNEYRSSYKEIESNLKALKKLTSDNLIQQVRIGMLQKFITNRISMFEKSIILKNQGVVTSEEILTLVNLGKSTMDLIKTLKEMIRDEEDRLLQIRQDRTEVNLTKSNIILIISSLISVTIIILVTIFIRIDIQDRMNHEITLREMNLNKIKFFSIISHDLRGPIHGIAKLSSFMEEETIANKEEAVAMGRMINKTALQVGNLLENLLTWARLQMGKIEFSPSEFDIKEVIQENIHYLEGSVKSKSISIESNIIQSTIYADKNMIETIVRNLIQNAIKYTEHGGNIEINSFLKDDGSLLFSVKDNGIGIQKEKLATIFSLEKTSSAKGTDNEKGSGLGLILCKEFAEKNRGKVWIESEVGKGTTSYLSIPART